MCTRLDTAFSKDSQRLILQRAKENVAARHNENIGHWMHADGRLFLIAKVLFVIAAIYNLVLCTAYLIGGSLALDAHKYGADATMSVRLSAACCVLLVAAIVLAFLQKYYASAACAALGGIPMLPFYLESSIAIIGAWKKIWMHLFPVSLMILFSAYIIITLIIDRIEVRREYNAVIDKIYAANSEGAPDRMTTEEEWESYVKSYLDGEQNTRKMKRSVKAKSEKNKN